MPRLILLGLALRPGYGLAVDDWRLGARCLLYGPLNTAVPADKIVRWLKKLMAIDLDDPMADLAVI